MKITLKHAKKQKVKKYLASNNFYVIHQQYPKAYWNHFIKNHCFHLPLTEKRLLSFQHAVDNEQKNPESSNYSKCKFSLAYENYPSAFIL